MASGKGLQELLAMVDSDSLDMDLLDQALNESDADTRLAFVRALKPARQKKLFEAAKGRKVTLDLIVPPDQGELSEVIHEGKNTLPAFTHFQKRFCRPSLDHDPEGRTVIWGYNHLSVGAFTGPGYFVAYDDHEEGEVVIDYRELPPEKPEAWPTIIGNHKKLSIFIYNGMVDRLRRVSDHVTIGRAFKGGKAMSAWFALVRQD